MNAKVVDALQRAREDAPTYFAEPATIQEITAAEQALGVAFHADYVEFLQLCGSALLGPRRLFGVRRYAAAPPDYWSVVAETLAFRDVSDGALDRWYVVSNDESYPICVKEDGTVIGWYYDSTPPPERKLAASFQEYLASWCAPFAE